MEVDDDSSDDASAAGLERLVPVRRYRQLFASIVISILVVSVVPLVVMLRVSLQQHDREVRAERLERGTRILAAGQRAVEELLSTCSTSLIVLVRETPYSELAVPQRLDALLSNLRRFPGGVDALTLLDAAGRPVAHAGSRSPGRWSQEGGDWFEEAPGVDVSARGVTREGDGTAHCAVAVRCSERAGETFVLRASIEAAALQRSIAEVEGMGDGELFLIDDEGLLQTPSRRWGELLDPCPLQVPSLAAWEPVVDPGAGAGQASFGFAAVEGSPFTLVLAVPSASGRGLDSLRWGMILFTVVSIVLILAAVVWGSKYMVGRIRHGDRKRAALFHDLEYTNKMETIGRLGAGVAHEINNPMAIINQQAGLLKDILTSPEELPPTSELLRRIDAVLRAVARCSAITHQLLGFGRQVDTPVERIDLRQMAEEVLGFLDQGDEHRDIAVVLDVDERLPVIRSDRGRLQQVFLNLLNNAFAAVADSGRIQVSMNSDGEGVVVVHIEDDGVGIAEEHLGHVFEPFFTTKKGSGTGLGLSVTYGIVNRLGGKISVSSTLGVGTRYTVNLPIERT